MFFEAEEAEYRESIVLEEKLHGESCFKTMHQVKVYSELRTLSRAWEWCAVLEAYIA